MQREIIGLSDIGKRRTTNQDAFYVDSNLRFAVLCDGIGGARGGNIAANLTVDCFRHVLEQCSFATSQDVRLALAQGANQANARVHRRASQDRRFRGMGTTVNALAFYRDRLLLCHVGDSRSYLYHDRYFWQLTIDHNVKTQMQRGAFTLGLLARRPSRKALTRAIGLTAECQFEIYEVGLSPEAIVISSTDGLFDLVSDFKIYQATRNDQDPLNLATKLVEMANEAGGRDNTTVIISKCTTDLT